MGQNTPKRVREREDNEEENQSKISTTTTSNSIVQVHSHSAESTGSTVLDYIRDILPKQENKSHHGIHIVFRGLFDKYLQMKYNFYQQPTNMEER